MVRQRILLNGARGRQTRAGPLETRHPREVLLDTASANWLLSGRGAELPPYLMFLQQRVHEASSDQGKVVQNTGPE